MAKRSADVRCNARKLAVVGPIVLKRCENATPEWHLVYFRGGVWGMDSEESASTYRGDAFSWSSGSDLPSGLTVILDCSRAGKPEVRRQLATPGLPLGEEPILILH